MMENYRNRLLSQKEALQTDIDTQVLIIKQMEEELDKVKEAKSLAQRELRGIEKKLDKIKG